MLFRFLSSISVIGYIAVMVWSIRYNLVPLFAHYGAWNWLGMNVLFFVLGTIAAFSAINFWVRTPSFKPPTPMATYKETDRA